MATRTPTRFPRGVNNLESNDRFNGFGLPDRSKWIVYWNDFADATDSLPSATDANYTITKTGAGTLAQADGLGGWSLITNAAGIADAVWVQKKGEAFKWSASKKLYFGCRFKVSDATQSVIVFGLQITDTTPADVTDGFFFIKADEAATVEFRVEKNDTASTAAAFTTLVADTFVELAFGYDPAKTQLIAGVTTYYFDYFVNGDKKGTVTASTNVCDDEELCVSFGMQNGEAVAKNMTVDYVFAALER